MQYYNDVLKKLIYLETRTYQFILFDDFRLGNKDEKPHQNKREVHLKGIFFIIIKDFKKNEMLEKGMYGKTSATISSKY